MANTIITKNSATTTAVPTAGQLVQGELAVNVTDKRLFTENSGGTVVELGTNPSQLNFADNAKAIFGAGSDLQIYHDGAVIVWVQDARYWEPCYTLLVDLNLWLESNFRQHKAVY